MKSIIKISFLSVAIFFAAASLSLAQDSTMTAKHQMKMGNMKMDNTKMEMKSTEAKVDSSIIRKGVIDLKAIDKNKDGKVYEDVMDYNVISDKPGKCPICGMTLKKVSLAKAKSNLEKAGFKVK